MADDAAAVQRVVTRWGAELLAQRAGGDQTRLEARLVAARLHELQRQLPDLTRGEGVLDQLFDSYQPVQGQPPVRTRQPPGAVTAALSATMRGQLSRP